MGSEQQYDRVPLGEENNEISIEEEEDDDVLVNKEAEDDLSGTMTMEIESGTIMEPIASVQDVRDDRLCSLTEPWFVTSIITIFFIVPTLVMASWFVYDLTATIWPAAPLCLHLTLTVWCTRCLIPGKSLQSRRPSFLFRLIPSVLDIWLLGRIYAIVWWFIMRNFFTDIDGTTVTEYANTKRLLNFLRVFGMVAAFLRAFVNGVTLSLIFYTERLGCRLPRFAATAVDRVESIGTNVPPERREMIRLTLRRILLILVFPSLCLLLWTIVSGCAAWIPWSAPTSPQESSPLCDPLDTTECALPFPSSFHMMRDESTTTGFRLNLRSKSLPPLKGGGRKFDPAFLNELDGFSTMTPALFYLAGMKEAFEVGVGQARLCGHEELELSTTSQSITLLVDVEAQSLVAHSAEIDYLDPDRPLAMVIPAQPLKHNTWYAVAVVGAVGVDGELLPRTNGMKALLTGNGDAERLEVMTDFLLPSLQQAAPWVNLDDESIQLLFDFHTVSTESQLGPARSVRDTTISIITDEVKWGDWTDHVRLIDIQDNTCLEDDEKPIARTIYAEMDVPWFLNDVRRRDAFMDSTVLSSGEPSTTGIAKFVVHIPCSLKAAAYGSSDVKLRAVMDYGHSLLYNRMEASESTLPALANDNGYILMAMDWRGMSSFDLFVVVKVLMSRPGLFRAIRDNLLQGYANKLCLQHFAQSGLLEMPWFEFDSPTDGVRSKPIPLFDNNKPPAMVFYGISQGGILGAGYTALAGPTGLIDRGVLGVPGISFSFVMTRSMAFVLYDNVLRLNFYNNRHIRMFLSLAQSGYDPTEGAGQLAPPLESTPPPMLLQAGLGDAVVTTFSAEALTRAYGGAVLPNNPRTNVYGIPVKSAAGKGSKKGPHVTLTEILFRRDYEGLPPTDELSDHNEVHPCVRTDSKAMSQIAEFVNTGRVIDICENDGCIREVAHCY